MAKEEGDGGDGDGGVVGPREHLVTTAVKFLQNPKVISSSIMKKQEFLRKKGMTEEEIELAFKQGGVYEEPLRMNHERTLAVGNYKRNSLLLKAMDVANMIALISIGSYSLYSLWKSYIAPRIFGTRSRLEQKYERLLESITELNRNVVELRELLREVQIQSLASSGRSLELQEVRKEIAAIKTLLLGRSQFPSPATSMGIPSWQMVEEGDNSNENSDESGSHRMTSKKDKDRSKHQEQQIQGPIRKHPSIDSNYGMNSASSCEVVGKNDSSDPDHSE